ncbi:transglutaminase family protein, partial [Bacteroidales bacterium AH-315-I05]|nr:transglutaminase family protein [Bacteroidales bacterium AH-315-I05]
MKPEELNALIALLDDPDESVYSHVKDKLIDMGDAVIPLLESAWEQQSLGMLFQDRVEEIIHTIQFENTQNALLEWSEKGGSNLLEGVLAIARYQYPDLDEEQVKKQLKQIEKDIWLELNDHLTALEKVNIMNHIIYDVHGFSGNTTNYHAPQNSYLNTVLESKKGNPISLAVIFILVAQKLDLPIYGINLPRHFVLAYADRLASPPDTPPEKQKVLFYINPFSRGNVLSKREVEHFLKQLKIESKSKFFQPCSNIATV